MSIVMIVIALLWVAMPLAGMVILGGVYARRWDRLERRLLAYIESRLNGNGQHDDIQTTEFPRVQAVPGRGVGAARLPPEFIERPGGPR